ncbi:MAG: ATP-binding protein [Saprospiraceae bacterium]
MKYFVFIVYYFLLVDPALSQDTVKLENLGLREFKLDKGWKFHEGDNPEWANSDFEDQSWKPINPLLQLHILPQVRKAGIGWFKLKLKVDSSFRNENMVMVISTVGASEIYLNGDLIQRFGTVSPEYKLERTRFLFYHPFSLRLGTQPMQDLAVRYSFNKKNLYTNINGAPPCLELILKENSKAFTDFTRHNGLYQNFRSIQLSFYLPLGFLILFLYFSYRLKKEYLYIGIFSFCMFLGMLLQILGLMENRTVTEANYYLLGHEAFWVFGMVTFLNGAYILLQQEKKLVFYIISFYAFLILPVYFLFYEGSQVFASFFTPVVLIEFLRISLKAFLRKMPGTLILVITGIGCLLLILATIGLDLIGRYESAFWFYSICFVTPAIGLSLFFAGEFARTGLTLQLRVVEVEQLSEKTIAQEKEKQSILESQNETLELQVKERTVALTQSLAELKDTQTQLIQKEKMASLGELTAGIAHEIQNPLNFVNNFSEVNTELIDELKTELATGNMPQAIELANDIKDNELKINQHGQRASNIVKNKLEHSRKSSGLKEPTNINVICDEYLTLSYQSMRAKDSKFNCDIKLDLDPNLPKVNVVAQDISRVILNLVNNAFYACAERSHGAVGVRKSESMKSESNKLVDYRPLVTITTKYIEKTIEDFALLRLCEIFISDNGNGISDNIKDKIFQPFFTTKPTGQGTGLGLSLSYDIIKAHNGIINMNSSKEGSNFQILLPIQ